MRDIAVGDVGPAMVIDIPRLARGEDVEFLREGPECRDRCGDEANANLNNGPYCNFANDVEEVRPVCEITHVWNSEDRCHTSTKYRAISVDAPNRQGKETYTEPNARRTNTINFVLRSMCLRFRTIKKARNASDRSAAAMTALCAYETLAIACGLIQLPPMGSWTTFQKYETGLHEPTTKKKTKSPNMIISAIIV